MCGIAGIVGKISQPNRDALKRIKNALSHRGPDGEGEWESAPDERGWGVMFAHLRLAIIDLTPAGSQPMVDPVTGDVIVFNGEIYNYADLRRRLIERGEHFQSSGDTAVMLRVLGLDGRDAVRSLRGMFAFAFWDNSERKLVLGRDPLGIKPLYVAYNANRDSDWSVVFASEVRALLASGLLGNARLNPRAVASVAWNGFVVSPETAIAGVYSIWPGQTCVFNSFGREENSEFYWSVTRNRDAAPISEAHFGQVLEDTVQAHLVSDVPVAVFLSGGIDLSAVANLAHKSSKAPIHTFTLAFEEKEFNEGEFARQIAAAIGTQHQEFVLTEQHFIEQFDKALDSLDQPTFDGINTYYMSDIVRQAGFKVVLVGTGGDELFGGYTSFRDLPTLLRWSRRVSRVPREMLHRFATLVSSLLQPSRGSMPQQTRWAKFPEMVRRGDDLLALYQLAYALFLPDFLRQLAGGPIADMLVDGLPPRMHSRLLTETKGLSPLAAISVLEQRLFLGERLLRDADATSMANSIEMRLPLVDHVLFENVSGLSERTRYFPVGKKALLRRAGLRGLDPALFDRPKSGFTLPYDRWLRTKLGKVVDQTMRDPHAVKAVGLNPDIVGRLWLAFLDNSSGVYWSRIWALYVFIRWCHRHRVFL